MKRSRLALVVFAANVFALGHDMGWFRLASEGANGKSKVTLTVDRDTIGQDENKAIAAVHDLDQRTEEKTAATTQLAASPPP